MREQHSMNNALWWEVYDSNGNNVGVIHSTYHSIFPYEAFYNGLRTASNRTYSLDDAEAWILVKAREGNE